MDFLNEIYEKNCELDLLFNELFGINDEIRRKNIFALLVEIAELANETRVFKYWSNKKPSSKEVILEEYADCLLLTLCICNDLKADINRLSKSNNNSNIIDEFLTLYQVSSKLVDDYNDKQILIVLMHIINLGKLLEYEEKEVYKACLQKIEKNFNRLKNGY